MNILWVENHESFVRVVLRTFLSGHTVTVVPSLAEAREALAEQVCDAILLDYDLDDGKGVELLPEIRAQAAALQEASPRACRPIVIAASSHAAGNQALLDAGADGVCSKSEFASIQQVIGAHCRTIR